MVRFTSYEWEKKGIVYQLKYAVRHAPHLLLAVPMYLAFVPGCCYYLWLQRPAQLEREARYKQRLLVYRHDDPKLMDFREYDPVTKKIKPPPSTK